MTKSLWKLSKPKSCSRLKKLPLTTQSRTRSTIRTCRNGTLSFTDWCWSRMVRLRSLVRGRRWNPLCMHNHINRKQLCHLFYVLKLNMVENLSNKIINTNHLIKQVGSLPNPTTDFKDCFTTQNPSRSPLMTVCRFTTVIVSQMLQQLLITRWVVTAALGHHLSVREAILIIIMLLLQR